jgi:hypothetical protein
MGGLLKRVAPTTSGPRSRVDSTIDTAQTVSIEVILVVVFIDVIIIIIVFDEIAVAIVSVDVIIAVVVVILVIGVVITFAVAAVVLFILEGPGCEDELLALPCGE